MNLQRTAGNLGKNRLKFISGTAAGVVAVLLAACVSAPDIRAQQQKCDRAGLGKVLDGYLSAVFHHQPEEARLAASYRSTENAVVTPAGDGIWKTATGFGELQRRYFDTTTGQAAYFGLLREGEATDIVSLRLKVDSKRKVSEAEWTIARKAYGGLFDPQGLVSSPPPDHALPASERVPRATLIATANAYFDGLQEHDGSKVPTIEGCDRVENGIRVTHRVMPIPGSAPGPAGPNAQGAPTAAQGIHFGDCNSGFENFAKSISETSHRRFLFADEDYGLVIGMSIFHRPPEATMKRNLLTEYIFEKNGKLAYIGAAMYFLDPSAPDDPGWPE